ncbi:MAG: alkyl hydroperoxide reductase subunit F [Candidatus Accumulibacter sp.]|jgi:alkyl hydroperoxide reductase subunit F|nr:alkyl hydroperoxide reductase subunit F [Accumulibacter sp.]
MLDAAIKTQLKTYLERLQRPIELVASLDDGARSGELRALLEGIAELSDRVRVRFDGQEARRPSFSVGRQDGEAARIRFAGIPMGHEFTSLVLALLQTGGHPPKIEAQVAEQIRALSGTFRFETFVSLSCHNCPDVVQALNAMAALNPGVSSTMIDGAVFQDEAEERQIMAVPTVLLNGEPFGQGRMTIEEIVARLDTGATAREAEKIAARAAFDVLIVGGGPAGAAAAIYAARKGLRTGIVAERFGGQVLDTLSIENLISVKETDGPRLASALEQHVREHDVDIMKLQRAESLAAGPDGLTEVRLASGASLKGRAVIVTTGARWRNMGVPGEQEYKARGVAYCPHCDGPLFKGKRVAVVGGGNSGVEAAIDLAGIAAHVTLIVRSFLRADATLRGKLLSLPNTTMLTQTRVLEVTGDGEKVNGLVYKNCVSGETQRIDLEGIFVQIGQLPNTDWLKDTLNLSPRGEIEIDDRGRTSMKGVFAAGDCTTVPFKQIVIAMGEGAKASLAAFDHLVRSSTPAG